jgi:hypothetical protein
MLHSKINVNLYNVKIAGILIITLMFSAVLLFARLDHYALWDDEAMDALSAKSILETGDTTARVGHNIVAYRNGLLLHHLRLEGSPPFTAYLAAISMKILGENTFAARFPMALFGLCSVMIMLWWIWIKRPPLETTLIFMIALLCNVSFFLYNRQCRYYAAAMFFYVAVSFIYLNLHDKKTGLGFMGLLLSCLMAVNPTLFIAIYVCLLADYLIWQRKNWQIKFSDLVILFAPQLMIGIILLLWWNPLHTAFGSYMTQNSIGQRVTLFFWNWRDLTQSEMIIGLVCIAALIIAFKFRDIWLKRATLALFVYIAVITMLSPQIVGNTVVADVRYLSASLPLCLAIETLALSRLMEKTTAKWLIVPLAFIAFGTNLLNGGVFFQGELRSTIIKFTGELIHPPTDPYTVTATWIKNHVKQDESILVFPGYMTYPLMFHMPKAVYAWQLKWPPAAQFKGLPLIHFQKQIPPDYVIIFGPVIQWMAPYFERWDRAKYVKIAVIDHYWKDLHRPELFWRSFTAIRDYDRTTEAIYIFKRKDILARDNR